MREIISSIKINISYISNVNYKKYQNKIYQIESLEFIENEDLTTLDDIIDYLEEEYSNIINDN